MGVKALRHVAQRASELERMVADSENYFYPTFDHN